MFCVFLSPWTNVPPPRRMIGGATRHKRDMSNNLCIGSHGWTFAISVSNFFTSLMSAQLDDDCFVLSRFTSSLHHRATDRALTTTEQLDFLLGDECFKRLDASSAVCMGHNSV